MDRWIGWIFTCVKYVLHCSGNASRPSTWHPLQTPQLMCFIYRIHILNLLLYICSGCGPYWLRTPQPSPMYTLFYVLYLRRHHSCSRCSRHISTLPTPASGGQPDDRYSNELYCIVSYFYCNSIVLYLRHHISTFPNPQEGSLMIGSVDEIQKLHVRALPLHEQPRRIAHQEATRTFGLLAIANMVRG